ncbi:MAG: hypothetical protein L0J05_04760 [Tetragenococcus halophilus]|nr:hypothetical protein [Tetragenococcus halophilus]MDN6748968.1 hypothetical protein [Staphylococcus equorum]
MKKIILTTLAAATLANTITPTVINVSANQVNDLEQTTINKNIDGDSIEITVTEDSYTVTNKDLKEQVTVKIIDENNATLTDENGNVSNIYKDENGNAYLDGELFATQTKYYDETLAGEENSEDNPEDNPVSMNSFSALSVNSASAVPIGQKVSSTDLAPYGSRYIYGYTTKTTTQFRSNARSLATAIAGVVPFLSVTVAVAGIIDGIKNINSPMLYIKQHVYHTSGYKFYKYKTYMYSKSNYTQQQGKTITQYRQMWN